MMESGECPRCGLQYQLIMETGSLRQWFPTWRVMLYVKTDHEKWARLVDHHALTKIGATVAMGRMQAMVDRVLFECWERNRAGQP